MAEIDAINREVLRARGHGTGPDRRRRGLRAGLDPQRLARTSPSARPGHGGDVPVPALRADHRWWGGRHPHLHHRGLPGAAAGRAHHQRDLAGGRGLRHRHDPRQQHRRAGEHRARAAARARPVPRCDPGCSEVWPAVLASTLTTVLVFVPIVFIEEEAGQLYSDIAIAMSASILASMLVAITVVPTASARFSVDRDGAEGSGARGADTGLRQRLCGRSPGCWRPRRAAPRRSSGR